MLRLINKIIALSGKYKWRIYVAFVFSFVKSMLLKAPVCLSFLALNRFLERRMTPGYCVTLFGMMAASVILQIIFQNIADRLQSGAGYLMFADLRNELGVHLRRMPMGYFTEGNIGKISSVLSTDMVFVEENCMTAIAGLMSDIFAEIIMILFMYYINPVLGVAATIIAAGMLLVGKGMEKETLADSVTRQEQSENLTEAVLDFAEGMGIIKTYNLLGKESKELSGNFQKSCDTNIGFEENHAPWQRWMGIAYGIGTVATLVSGYAMFANHMISLGYFIGLLLFLFDLYSPMKVLYSQLARLTVMNSCVDRMQEVFEEMELPNDGTRKISESKTHAGNEIEFKNVDFSYGKKQVLDQISFAVKPDTMTALVGPSGSGKSTIASLITRFWDVTGGTVKVRGVDIREVPLAELMDQISMVFQRVYLFEDTIYNNICIGRPDATEEEVAEAAKKARCYDFIMNLPDGFQTVVGEGGSSLSGGEKQRISIARCILKDAPIVILDEATASVDVDNESYIQEAISELCRGKTLLVIAHRLNTIANADHILVIENGRIVQRGTHDELVQCEGVYRNFVNVRTRMKGWSA
ncbi:ABC transporter ATP-binding protein [Hespellia stercorisuis]|uniref:ATP-binding cassette, subfamily B n=1 Tax=Hespellia stercorisuis DSM 15480 TaxID=1121950 RepID=A0A1M6IBY1_9FIRM|nr:ABC transporter ATP-binding protein [Hespellia stercorisuis]SHJ31989.1 ATP-binding cassette, subfamily B [Hespellia stercorisuis DSM 15480]